jgi:3-methyladenine DNA glycosylase AlkD
MTPAGAGAEAIVAELGSLGSEKNRAGMAHYGIRTDRAFGISLATLTPIARRLGRNHGLARDLWRTGWHEARLLAIMIDNPRLVTRAQMNRWAAAFDSWDLCDQACSRLFARTPYAEDAIQDWAKDEREFVRRAAFALIAAYGVHGKRVPDARLAQFLPVIERYAKDDRNFVRKAVNWALRQIGKRSVALHEPALALAQRLAQSGNTSARWIGRDAVRELTDPVQMARIRKRG